jgi:hypothetical protein
MDDIGSGAEAINYAIEEIDDHFDRLQFLRDWRDGSVARHAEWKPYFEWLKTERAHKQEPVE